VKGEAEEELELEVDEELDVVEVVELVARYTPAAAMIKITTIITTMTTLPIPILNDANGCIRVSRKLSGINP